MQRTAKSCNGAASENSGMCGNGTAEISEARQRKSGVRQRKECKGAVQRSSVTRSNGIEMNRSAMDWHGAAQQRL